MPDAAARHGPDPIKPSVGDPIAELIARLRQIGLDPDAEQLCDTLWLARWARPTDAVAPAEGNAPSSGAPSRPGRHPVPERAAPRGPAPAAPWTRPEPQPAGGGDRSVRLYPVPLDGGPQDQETGQGRGKGEGQRQQYGYGQGRGRALPIGVPAAPAFAAPIELQRALRPLQGYRTAAPPLRTVLDETETAELSAQAGGLVLPVFRAVTRADAALQLVMDASSSMRVWARMFAELEQVFGQLGAFSDIEVSHLHQGPDGAPAVSRSPEPQAAPLHSADRLSDPTGRRITLLVSDCAGPLWHSGQAHRLLYHLSRLGPAAVLQPLPQRMWNRTRLPVSYGELARGEGLAGAATLKVLLPTGVPPEARSGALPVPVLPPEPTALGAWARLLCGAGAGSVSGAVGWVRHDHPPVQAARPARRLSALELVSRFRSNASKTAGRLAGYLAAAPLYLPVMQLVQRTMLPDTGPSELAEFLLSGLVGRPKAEERGADDAQWYEFAPGVQEALLSPLGRDEAALVLKHCSEYIEYRFGRGGPNFPALALAQLGEGGSGRPYAPGAGYPSENGDNGWATLVPQPFAEVAARVLERFMPLPEQFAVYGGPGPTDPPDDLPTHAAVIRARSLVGQFDTDGMVQDLIDAVQLLRGATEHERPVGADLELWGEYATCLLRLWEVQGGTELLREAEAAAERAVAHPRALRERAVLARVLHAAATDRRRHGDRRGALDLLQRADREYAVACAAPDLEPLEALRLTLERVRALEAQWRLGGDSALLQGAVGMLEAFADVWPDRSHRPPELPLAHGRVLLRLSGTTPDHEQARLYAEQGAHSLRAALEPGPEDDTATGAGPAPDRVRILLDLVDALLKSGGGLDDAQGYVDEALSLTREQGVRAALLVRAGRIKTARYAESGDPRELRDAAERFEQASRGVPRDAPAHADVLAEWGEVLLRRAVLDNGPGTRESLSRAIRVLRDCRTETPAGGGELAYRLLLLGRALMLRYRVTGDRVDLREAEYLFGLAALEAGEPLTAARCWLELGQAQFEAYQSLGRPARLDEAMDAFRAAAESARAAEGEAETDRGRQAAVELGAQAHHWRGMSYEAAARPRAAREAYRAARTEWSRLPDGALSTGEPTARQTAQRLAELE